MKVTKKQKQVYDFILEYCDEFGYAPTQIEIKDHFSLKSLGSVQDYLKYLKNAGLIEHDSHSTRGITPVIQRQQSESHAFTIPLMGEVAAGSPLEEIVQDREIEVPSSILPNPKGHYALLTRGDSMINDGILDGDYLIVKQINRAQNGQTIIASIDNSVTVKKYFLHPKNEETPIELRPANDNLQPKFYGANEVAIKGVLVGLIRAF